jgi:hypothetical protein
VIGASTIEKCKKSVSKIANDRGHFTLSSAIDAIHVKRVFVRALSDERGTRIGAGSALFNRLD